MRVNHEWSTRNDRDPFRRTFKSWQHDNARHRRCRCDDEESNAQPQMAAVGRELRHENKNTLVSIINPGWSWEHLWTIFMHEWLPNRQSNSELLKWSPFTTIPSLSKWVAAEFISIWKDKRNVILKLNPYREAISGLLAMRNRIKNAKDKSDPVTLTRLVGWLSVNIRVFQWRIGSSLILDLKCKRTHCNWMRSVDS